jgi:hypothetical protein
MRRIRQLALIISALVALLAVPALAQASGTDVIRDCNYDGHIDGTYSQSEYQDAQNQLQGDNDQYSDCRDVIAQARASAKNADKGSGGSGSGGSGGGSSGGAAGGGGGSSGSGSGASAGSGGGTSGSGDTRAGSPVAGLGDPKLATASGAYAPTSADKLAYEKARADTSGGGLADGLVVPSASSFNPDGANSIPLPVLIAIVSVGLLVVATSALVARKQLPAVRRVALRVVRR